jgi:DNA-3-methyladenine glycosylase II
MALRRADIWPASDLALAIAMMKLKELPFRPNPKELVEMAEQWRPYRSVAARMLWQYYLAGKAVRKKTR